MTTDPTRLKNFKLVFTGLNNAGKTSFLIALRKKYNFYERVEKLKPTIKVDYSSFNFLNRWVVNCWDMGGQEKYRAMFIDNPVYLSDTNVLYYLIDIQDEEKFDASLSYLKSILSILLKLKYSNEVIICFNKSDPKFKNEEIYLKRVENLKEQIIDMIPELKSQFFYTSIYDISSLSTAISYSLNKLLDLNAVTFKIEQIVDNLNCSYAILYTNYGLIISDYYKKPIDSREFEEMVYDRINNHMVFIQKLYDSNVEFSEILSSFNNNAEYLRKLVIASSTRNTIMFLNVLANSLIKEELLPYVNELEEILEEVII